MIREKDRRVFLAFSPRELALFEKEVKSSFNFNSCGEKINLCFSLFGIG